MKKIFFMLMTFAFITSCADEELGPILTFEKATIGSYIRLVQLNTGEFDLDNTGTSALDFEVDFVDQAQGKEVNEYKLEVQFLDNTPAGGSPSLEKRVYKTFSKGDFSDSANGNQGMQVVIPFTDLLTLFGITADDVLAGDNFAFFGSVTQDDGATYASTNSTSTVRGSAFQGYFDFNGKATCPQPNDVFVGDYMLTFDGDNGLGYGAPYPEGMVTVSAVPGSSTLREFGSIVLPGIGGFGPYTTRFDLVCDKTEFVIMDTDGLGCGGGGIMFGPAINDDGLAIGAPLDLTDDSSFELIFNEGFASGGCAGQTGSTATKIVLTKI